MAGAPRRCEHTAGEPHVGGGRGSGLEVLEDPANVSGLILQTKGIIAYRIVSCVMF